GSFATLNYYLRNGFVSARKNLLRPPHYVDESWVLLLRREGIDQQHAMVLKAIETQFNER
ncbi:MAG: hypothetical protein M3O61_19880, partial [Gemmatimonadota bacterium]|nr:hypothetical protein [Gemmatimonadota bacterium]